MNQSGQRIRRLTVLAMMTALSFAAVFFIRIPVVLFLDYEPKDVLIAIGAFLYGPLAGAIMSVVVSLLELVTFSTTGIIGFIMNCISSCLFVCTAAIIYHRKKTLGHAIGGLIAGTLLATAGMLLWNWLITPMYMHVPRSELVSMLLPIFLPFNLLKNGLNTALTMLLYKGVSNALHAAHLLPQEHAPAVKKKRGIVTITTLTVLVMLILILLAWKGII